MAHLTAARFVAMVALALVAAFAAVGDAWAIGAKPAWRTFTQSDGTQIAVRLVGDENMRYYVTTDGVPLVRTASGDFCYATTTGFRLSSSGVVAHELPLRNAGESAIASNVAAAESLRAFAPRLAAKNRSLMTRSIAAKPVTTGVRRALVIMVEFPDRQFLDDDSHEQWDAIFNEKGYSEHGAAGSVADYFRDQSGGLLDLTFDIYGPVVASKSRAYYGRNNWNDSEIDLNIGKLVVEACEAVRSQVDFSAYDWDQDGFVDQVYILYAGGGEHVDGNDSDLIWPHQFYVSCCDGFSEAYEIDGYYIDSYACGSELGDLEQSQDNSLSGTGVFCHEYSHCLGLLDLYSYSQTAMLGPWDIMDEGSYNNDGWSPAGYSAYEKKELGWIEPIELNGPATIASMLPTAQGGEAYIVRNECADESVDEYFIIENRQQTGWDAYLPGSGIVVTHVDYDEEIWANNAINDNGDRPNVDIIPANNIYSPYANIAYPCGGNDSLTDNSRPAARVNNLNLNGTRLMSKPITAMSVVDGVASFNFMGGQSTSGKADATAIGAATAIERGPNSAAIYDASGRHVASVDDYRGLPATLRPGLYVVKTSHGTRKILKY